MVSALYNMWNGSYSITEVLILLGSYAVLIFLMLPAHECAHAYAAYKLGDNTARWSGRLTLNPIKHLDPIGTTMLLLFGIGYAKPVPVNPYNFRNRKRGMALTALAGPVSNLLMAILSVGIFRIIMLLSGDQMQVYGGQLYYTTDTALYLYLIFIQVFAGINIALAVFNLIPIPPLDGSRIFASLLPDKWVYTMERYQMYISIAFIAVLFSGVLDVPLALLRHGFGFLICGMFGMPNVF